MPEPVCNAVEKWLENPRSELTVQLRVTQRYLGTCASELLVGHLCSTARSIPTSVSVDAETIQKAIEQVQAKVAQLEAHYENAKLLEAS